MFPCTQKKQLQKENKKSCVCVCKNSRQQTKCDLLLEGNFWVVLLLLVFVGSLIARPAALVLRMRRANLSDRLMKENTLEEKKKK